jgi:hypothetical protein
MQKLPVHYAMSEVSGIVALGQVPTRLASVLLSIYVVIISNIREAEYPGTHSWTHDSDMIVDPDYSSAILKRQRKST